MQGVKNGILWKVYDAGSLMGDNLGSGTPLRVLLKQKHLYPIKSHYQWLLCTMDWLGDPIPLMWKHQADVVQLGNHPSQRWKHFG